MVWELINGMKARFKLMHPVCVEIIELYQLPIMFAFRSNTCFSSAWGNFVSTPAVIISQIVCSYANCKLNH